MSHPERVQGGLSPGREQHLRVQHTSQYSIMSDSSLAEDILEKLQDFPVVPGPDLHPAPSPAPPISENGHAPGGGPDALSKLGDVHSELVDVPVVVEVGTDEDDEKILVDTSRLLHSHPNLVMEHFDPATNVHTFKIAYPPRHHPELARLSQPESMTTSGTSSPSLSPTTPQGVYPHHSSGLNSSPIRDRREAIIVAPGTGGYFAGARPASAASSSSTSASDSGQAHTKSRPYLHRKVSSPRYPDSLQAPLPPPPGPPSQISPTSNVTAPIPERHIRRPYPYQSMAITDDSDDATATSHPPASFAASSPSLGTDNYRQTAPHVPPQLARLMPAEELAAYEEFLVMRAATAHAHPPAPRPNPAPLHLSLDDASDFSWDAESVRSGHPSSAHAHGPTSPNETSRRASYMRPPPSAAVATQENLVHALSMLRAERAREGHLNTRPGSSATGSSSSEPVEIYGGASTSAQSKPPHVIGQARLDDGLQRQGSSHPSPAISGMDDLQELVPDFLELGAEAPEGASRSSFYGAPLKHRAVYDEEDRLAPVTEGSARSSEMTALERGVDADDDWADPVLAPAQRPPRKMQSAGELVSGRLPPSHAYVHGPQLRRLPPPAPEPIGHYPLAPPGDSYTRYGPLSAPPQHVAYGDDPQALYARGRDGHLYEVHPAPHGSDRGPLQEQGHVLENRDRDYERELPHVSDARYVVREGPARQPRRYIRLENGQMVELHQPPREGKALTSQEHVYRPPSRDKDVQYSHLPRDPRPPVRPAGRNEHQDPMDDSYVPRHDGHRGYPTFVRPGSVDHAPHSAPPREHYPYDQQDPSAREHNAYERERERMSPIPREMRPHSPPQHPPREHVVLRLDTNVHSVKSPISPEEHGRALVRPNTSGSAVSVKGITSPLRSPVSALPSVAGEALITREQNTPHSSHENIAPLPTRLGAPSDRPDHGAFEAPRPAPSPVSAPEKREDPLTMVESRLKVSGVLKPAPDLVTPQAESSKDVLKPAEMPKKATSDKEPSVPNKITKERFEKVHKEPAKPEKKLENPRSISPSTLEEQLRLHPPDADVYFAMGAGIGVSAMSFRSSAKKSKPKAAPKLSAEAKGKMRARAPEPESKSSTSASTDEHVPPPKPHRKGLFGMKKKGKDAE